MNTPDIQSQFTTTTSAEPLNPWSSSGDDIRAAKQRLSCPAQAPTFQRRPRARQLTATRQAIKAFMVFVVLSSFGGVVGANSVNAQESSPASEGNNDVQSMVEQAKKLAKVQRFEDACKLVEEAYLKVGDPELLRMLGEWHLQMKKPERAVGFFDSYLEDPSVADSSKERIRIKRLEALAAMGDNDAKAQLGRTAGSTGETPYDDIVEGWQFHNAGENSAGDFYLALGVQYTHNEGASFNQNLGGGGVEGDQEETFAWIHGGLGLRLEVGGYLMKDLGVGLSVGHDWMSWEHRAPSETFQTTTYSGLRPEFALHGRWFFSTGFFVGATTGADLVILTEGADIEAICEAQRGDCASLEPINIETGLNGWRWFIGPSLGFRTEVTSSVAMGVVLDLKYIPVFSASTALTETLEAYTDPSWMLNGALFINWNL